VNFSATPTLRTPAQKNGLNTVRLQIILNRKVIPIALGIAWPELLWDAQAGRCLSKLPPERRSPEAEAQLKVALAPLGEEIAKKATDYNLIIVQAQGKANDVAIRYRLKERHLTTDDFLREYNTGASKEDFLAYMQVRIEERHHRGQISHSTYTKHHSTLNKLREFAAAGKDWRKGKRKQPAADVLTATMPFCSFTHKFAGDFDAWLKLEHGSCQNTRSGRHRNVKAYLELARRDKIVFEDPYEYFVNSTVEGQWRALSPAELALLEEHYKYLPVGSTHRRMLQKFLFSCHCGLRLSDLKMMAFIKVQGQRMEFTPRKTSRFGDKEMILPITKKALNYLRESEEENDIHGFYLYTDQYTNRQLQRIGKSLGIETKLHHHIGRETFATNFSRRGGKVEVLQKLLGHKKLSMTMKYVHVDEAMKQAEIDRMDELDEQ
jgi:integrase